MASPRLVIVTISVRLFGQTIAGLKIQAVASVGLVVVVISLRLSFTNNYSVFKNGRMPTYPITSLRLAIARSCMYGGG
jgi:hypothetical protein